MRPAMSPSGERSPSRADMLAMAIAQALAAIPDVATGRTFVCGRSHDVPAGEVPIATLATLTGGRAIVHAAVCDLGSFAVASVLARGDRSLVLRNVQIHGDAVAPVASAIADWLRARGDSAPLHMNPLDVGFALLGALSADAPTASGWKAAPVTDYYRPDLAAGVSLAEVGSVLSAFYLYVTAREGGGVRVELVAERMGGERAHVDVDTVASFVDAVPKIVASTARALAMRDAFAARSFGVGHVVSLVTEALRHVGSADGGRWQATIRDDAYPREWPAAWIHFEHAETRRCVVAVTESASGCRIAIDGEEWIPRDAIELRGHSEAIAAAARRRIARLTQDALVVGKQYVVLAELAGIAVGEHVTLLEDKYVPYDGVHMYTFEASTGERVLLTEHSDEHVRMLSAIDRYLAPAP